MSVAVNKLDGVERADVSLNEGLVSVQFAAENAVTIDQLRRTIRDQGFSPRDAILTLSAVIEMRDGALVAVVPGSGAENAVTIDQLRRTIRDQGFSPRDAILTLSAVIEMRDGALVAVVPGSGAAFTLTAEEAIRTRLTSATGATVIVRGRVEADENDKTPTSLAVTLVGGG